MHRGLMMVGSLLGAFAVALGAFGAHALKQKIGPEELAVYQTGVQYHFYHVMAVFITASVYSKFHRPAVLWAGRFFIAGIVLFSGSLYLMTYLKAFTRSEIKWLGPITPLGGLFFIIGWLMLGWIINHGKVQRPEDRPVK
ncbi:MAG: DUF423 domain-containing protein [Chitinophagaceae bacterium]